MHLTLTHGSNATPDNPLEMKFQLFDYTRVNEKSQDARINNGIDGKGPGIYTVADENQWEFANGYAGNSGEGTTFGLQVNVDALANELEPDHISPDIWSDVIHAFIAMRHTQEGFDRDGAVRIFEQHYEEVPDLGAKAWLDTYNDALEATMGSAFSKADMLYVVEAIEEDPDGWEMHIDEHLETSDPISFIYDEGGPNNLPIQAIERSEHLWETLLYIWRACAIEHTGRGEYTYNETFYKAMKQKVPADVYPQAVKVDTSVYVVFDMEAIKITCAQRETYSPESKAKVVDILDTIAKIKPVTDKYSVKEGSVAIMAEVEKQHDVVLSSATALHIAMARNIDDYIVKLCRQDVGGYIVDDFEASPDALNAIKGISQQTPRIAPPTPGRGR